MKWEVRPVEDEPDQCTAILVDDAGAPVLDEDGNAQYATFYGAVGRGLAATFCKVMNRQLDMDATDAWAKNQLAAFYERFPGEVAKGKAD